MFSLHFRVCRFQKGIQGRPRRSGALSEPPIQPGAGGTSATLTRGRSPPPTGGRGCKLCSGTRPGPPCPPGAVGGRAALARGWSLPAHWGPGSRALLWRAASAPLLKKQSSSNINQNFIWLMFDIKCQPKLYLVDVSYQTSTGTVSG